MAYSQVAAQFAAATSYAATAGGRAESFITALNTAASRLQAPRVDVEAGWPTEAVLAEAAGTGVSLPSVSFPADDSGSAPGAPSGVFNPDEAPAAPVLPSFTYTPAERSDRPTLEPLTSVVLPDALGAWTPPTAPALLTISIAPFAGVDTHPEWADRLAAVPDDLTLAPPTAFAPPDTARYSSGLLDDMVSLLRKRAAGGTGLAPEVEQAIWDRARSRETAAAQANLDEVTRNAEARGFALPTGAFHAQLREAQKTLWAKTAELSRDVAIKQAELEQTNARHAIEQGIALETQLIRYVNDIEQRTFDAAKFAASNAVEIYNAIVTKYRVLLEKYSTYASVYRSLIEGERAKVDAYRAAVDAERAKVDINQNLVAQQRIEIEVREAQVALYKAELEAVQAVISMDKLKVETFGERIRAYVAEINAETSRVEVYKAQVQSNLASAEVYKAQVDAFARRNEASATAARARADIYDAEVRGFASKVQAYTARVTAEAEKARTYLGIEGLKIESEKTEIERVTSNGRLQIENYRALLGYYDMSKQVALQQAKILGDNYFALKSIVTDAAKVGAQVNAQMAASAYGTLHAGASISGSDSTNVQFTYSGDTSDTQAAPTRV